MKISVLGLFLILAVFHTPIYGQVSLVPVNHQVYEWLHLQRVNGNLSNYSYETLPLTRKQIFVKLSELQKKETKLNRIDHQLLQWYIQEFSPDQLKIDKQNTYTQGWDSTFSASIKRKARLITSRQEPHLFVFANDSISWVVDFFSAGGKMAVNDVANNFDNTAKVSYTALQTYGSVYDMLGGYLKVYNPYSDVSGMLQYHPEWGQTFDGRRAKNSSTLYAEAYASFQFKSVGVHIGNGDLKYGTKGSEALILRQDAGNFDWIRINLDTKYLQYTFIHGALKTNTVTVEVDGFPGVYSRISPERWFALRRIQITPAPWISMAFTESLIYSNRPVELSYLNPLLPLRFGEYETDDKDNPIWFFDGTLRLLRNLELYATLGIDDLLKKGDIFKPTGKRASEDAVVSYQAGFHYSLPTSTILNAEITQVDPYFYTHWQQFNTYDEFGSPLAYSIGPNSRQYFVSVRQWLPWRSFVEISLGKVKKGLNEYDTDGNLITDVGGDLFEGQNGSSDTVRLFAGDVHEWYQLNVKFEYEPYRGIQLFGAVSQRIMQQGEQLQDLNYLYAGVEFNFYPGVTAILSRVPGLSAIY